jgi:RNA polymerase sigma-70 factor (ECF subfamily)
MLPPTHGATHAGAAIDALYRAQYRPLLAHLQRLVGDVSAAEDLCHETFLKALRAWDQQAEILNADAWLRRIATNAAYDYLRRCRRIQFAPLDEAALPASAASMESRLHDQEPVWRVLAQLSPPARRLLLCANAGHSTEELAAALHCSDTAVRLRLFRARQQFRRAYAALGDE